MMNLRVTAGVAGLLLLLGGQGVVTQGPDFQLEDLRREYPTYDASLLYQVQRGLNRREAERSFRTSPGAAATFRRLVDANRMEEAIRSLETGIRGSTDGLIEMLGAISEKLSAIRDDASHGYGERVASIVAPLRSRLPTLPREDAARLAWRLMGIESQLSNRGSQGWQERITAFVEEYRGTRQALVAEVSLITSGRRGPASFAALDAFANTHAGTEVAAYAIYQKGFDLANNGQLVTGERYGDDPLNRFLQVIAVVEDLESGKYPDCEWVRKAPELVISFFFRRSPPVAFNPGSLDRMLSEYQRFLRGHFTALTAVDLSNSMGYVLGSRMAGTS